MTGSNPRRRLVLAVAAACATGLLGACGAGGGSASGDSGGTASVAPYPASSRILIENRPVQIAGESLVATAITATKATLTAFGPGHPPRSYPVTAGSVITTPAGAVYTVLATRRSTVESPPPGGLDGKVVLLPGGAPSSS